MSPRVGIIANPVSARDIRRIVSNAASLQITDRANIVLRVLACLRACGIRDVLMMPENGGIRHHVERGLQRAHNLGEQNYPSIEYAPIHITGTVEDSLSAAAAMRESGVAAIVVLGGDGTHRAVVARCGNVPIAGISTGTNNAFPEHREPTVTGLATGLAVTGRVPADIAFSSNKRIDVTLNDGQVEEISLVDVAIVTERYVGARALWKPEGFRELFVTFADPEVIGLSAIAGFLQPVSRAESGGLMAQLSPAAESRTVVTAPIAPGYLAPIGVDGWQRMTAGRAFTPGLAAGSIALDGERELSFSEKDKVSLTLKDDAFRTVNVSGVMRYAAENGLLRSVGAGLKAAE